jgi:diguanylate cyclase
MPMSDLSADERDAIRASRIGFARRSYIARTGGLAGALIMFAGLMLQKDTPYWIWVGPVVYCLLWPQLAWKLAQRSENPRDIERLNLLTDQFLVGIWMVPMEFSLLPCVITVVMTGMNTIAGGGWQLLLRGLILQALGVGVGVLIYGFVWEPHSSTLTILAAVPLLVFQPVAVGYVAHTAIRALNKKRFELERISQHDGLSGLFNRMHWEQLVRAEFVRFQRHGEPAVLVLADLDHFKRLNDTYGHAAGDEAIRRLAASFRRVLRETDVSGRYGGEEFGILLPNTQIGAAREVIDRLRRDMRTHPLMDEMVVTASFGMIQISPDITSVEEWIRLSDKGLYQAKNLGRDRMVDVGELSDTTLGRLETQT